ncbi:MAG: hypothetical protein ACRD3O_20620, partial [Terriglobia bacterium]
MDQKPKRKYTLSEKALAASRRNLEKANAVPNAIRYRPTPRRQAACRENLLKAHARLAARPRSPVGAPLAAPAACPAPSSSPAPNPENQSSIVNHQSSICRWG